MLGAALMLVHTGRAPTRSALTAELGVTRATAGAAAGELAALGLIRVDTHPTAPPTGTHGRPSHRLAVAPRGPVVLALQVHVDGYRAALVGLGGRVVDTRWGCVTVPQEPAAVIDAVVAAGADLLRATKLRCVGVGMAVPSAVSEPEGEALDAFNVAWSVGTPVSAELGAAVRRAGLEGPGGAPPPYFVGNDANLEALAEHRHGAGRDARHLLYVTTGHRGVGGALVLDGRLHTGSAGLALEVGHLTVDPAGRPCRCGGRGCLDVEADPLAFLQDAGRTPGPEPSLLRQAVDLLRQSDRDAGVRGAADLLADRLGLGLAGLVNILNPDRIVLGGLHSALLSAQPRRLHAVVAERSLWGRGVPLLPSGIGRAGLVGAAELAWQPVLDDPVTALEAAPA
ncbi:ROK family protein [Wenjunlia vitaminophila]|uniref:ROK family protein n=1 Tax=Wenjunlia vitaminophila TaxID=76728 RepID=UPI0003642797